MACFPRVPECQPRRSYRCRGGHCPGDSAIAHPQCLLSKLSATLPHPKRPSLGARDERTLSSQRVGQFVGNKGEEASEREGAAQSLN